MKNMARETVVIKSEEIPLTRDNGSQIRDGDMWIMLSESGANHATHPNRFYADPYPYMPIVKKFKCTADCGHPTKQQGEWEEMAAKDALLAVGFQANNSSLTFSPDGKAIVGWSTAYNAAIDENGTLKGNSEFVLHADNFAIQRFYSRWR